MKNLYFIPQIQLIEQINVYWVSRQCVRFIWMHEVCFRLPGWAVGEETLKGKWISGDRGRGYGLGPTCTPHRAPLHLQSWRIRIWFSLRKLEITKRAYTIPSNIISWYDRCVLRNQHCNQHCTQSPATITKQISILVSATSGLLNRSGWSPGPFMACAPTLSAWKVPVPLVQPGKEDSKTQLYNSCFSSSPDSLQFLTLLN